MSGGNEKGGLIARPQKVVTVARVDRFDYLITGSDRFSSSVMMSLR